MKNVATFDASFLLCIGWPSCLTCSSPPVHRLQGPCGLLCSRSWAINAARPLIFPAVLAWLLCYSEASGEEPGGVAGTAAASRHTPSLMSNKGTHHSWHPQMGSSRRQSLVDNDKSSSTSKRGSLVSIKSLGSFFHESSKEDVSDSLLTAAESSTPFHSSLTQF
jgi:hypothetical protein